MGSGTHESAVPRCILGHKVKRPHLDRYEKNEGILLLGNGVSKRSGQVFESEMPNQFPTGGHSSRKAYVSVDAVLGDFSSTKVVQGRTLLERHYGTTRGYSELSGHRRSYKGFA